ncbi:unnamed protein product [Rotaria sordida]|uniref:Pre-mRNA polyadenylation factor Fip1 domain-containing protein n=1 Tax=Rotaria sordida TaxID=392033 RepID=A0A818QHX7_9BILA|nr:unnamed protein product [Rotaria sordida]CAF1454981.1 unnamed protein product [Rotaria sordida]CAF3639419.1 unnamed protein product [Rotaria sordida]CAF3857940.1 unnamed protein product [Rotaria sordida]
MSKTMIDEIASLNNLITETDSITKESVAKNEDEETWLYGHNKSKSNENVDNTTAPSIDEITTQEINAREKATLKLTTTSLIGSQLDDDDSDDDDDDDDGIQVTIGDYEPEVSTFQTNRQKPRGMLSGGPAAMPPKSSITRGVDVDAQGVINGQPTYEHDIVNAYKDEEKPWKKPGADITEYFNYGFTEETWVQYCDRQRRLRNENNLARLNPTHIPPMLSGHPPNVHPINSHPVMMINKPMNMPMISRPLNTRKPDGKIDVIGATDYTSRRSMFETSNNFEHPPFLNGFPFLGGQPPGGQTVGDLMPTPSASNGPPPSGNTHHIPTLNMPRLPMIPLPPGIQFRAQFGHLHVPGGPQFLPRGPATGMHGDRLPHPYFIRHTAPQPWDKTGMPPVHNFPSGPFSPQITISTTSNNGRVAPPSRSPTPENRSSHSSTSEENRTNVGDNDKSSKDERYKERYRDDRDYHSSSRHRSSSSYHSRHRPNEHEYERPKNDRKSRDRDDKYDYHSRKRQHREDNTRHHYVDDESSRNYRSSHRTPTKTVSSPSKINSSISSTSIESSQILNEQTSESDQITSSSSSHYNHHKKSSKRSRHDSNDDDDDDERHNSHHRRRSKDKSKSNSKKSTNQIESLSDVKEQNNE